ncbi:MAG: 2Fe-2S iron-sulfur cluster-binding protein [Candidatus Bathyarchaeota archaeon]|nr:2Fe-2S iron-sulfur cluster-binding protein [Candidatus Bathyarchaeota archaeon]
MRVLHLGILLSGYVLSKESPRPTEEEVKTAIEGNICRCTGYVKIVEAILDASRKIAEE